MTEKLTYILAIILILSGLTACKPAFAPKPYAYFRVDLPEPRYVDTSDLGPFTAKINVISTPTATDDYFADKADKWINVSYPELNANIHLSYKKIKPSDFRQVSEESRTLAYKHTIRADAIKESFYKNDTSAVYGIFYEMTGNAASQAQFFVTDSVSNFLRGALYFNNTPNADSIAPIAAYIEQDMITFIETLKWKN